MRGRFFAVLAGCLVATAAPAQPPAGAVPEPFEPLRVREAPGGVEVAPWGRSYRFGAGPLPEALVSQGVALFAEPPRFEIDGQAVSWQAATLVESRPDEVRLRSIGGAPGLRVEAETRVEYDGMLAVRLRFEAERTVQIRRLDYVIALDSSAMRFFSHHLPWDARNENVDKRRLLDAGGALPPRLALPFTPTLALGDHRVGVEWWSETNAHWRGPRAARPFEVRTGGGITRLRVRPIAAPLALEPGAAWSDELALFAFPARPPAERWRSVRFLPYNRAQGFDARVGTRFVFLAMQDTFHARYDGLPSSLGDAAQRALREELRWRGVDYMPYGMLTVAPRLHPRTMSRLEEWSSHGKWWRIQPGDVNLAIRRNHPELGVGAPYGYAVCAARADYFDWMLEENAAAVRDEALDALYFDHGDISRMCVQSPILAGKPGKESWEYGNVRTFYKRLYERLKATRPDTLVVIHTHGAPKAIGAFVDFHVFGEALNGVFGGGRPASDYLANPDHYAPDYAALPAGYLEAHLRPTVGGVTTVIPQLKYAIDPLRPERARQFSRLFHAVMLPNDVLPPLWSSEPDTADAIYRALDRFGDLGDAVVHPWWANGASLRRPAGLHATAWVRDGRALLVLANLGASERRGRVELDGVALGLPRARHVRDLESLGRRTSLEAGGFPVTVPARDLRLFLVE